MEGMYKFTLVKFYKDFFSHDDMDLDDYLIPKLSSGLTGARMTKVW